MLPELWYFPTLTVHINNRYYSWLCDLCVSSNPFWWLFSWSWVAFALVYTDKYFLEYLRETSEDLKISGLLSLSLQLSSLWYSVIWTLITFISSFPTSVHLIQEYYLDSPSLWTFFRYLSGAILRLTSFVFHISGITVFHTYVCPIS